MVVTILHVVALLETPQNLDVDLQGNVRLKVRGIGQVQVQPVLRKHGYAGLCDRKDF